MRSTENWQCTRLMNAANPRDEKPGCHVRRRHCHVTGRPLRPRFPPPPAGMSDAVAFAARVRAGRFSPALRSGLEVLYFRVDSARPFLVNRFPCETRRHQALLR